MNSNSASSHLPVERMDSSHTDHIPSQGAGSKARMAAFSLMLVVPLALTGCSDDNDTQCEYDQYGNPYNCQEYTSSGGYRGSSSHYSKNSSSDSHSGFGSSGSSFSFFGG